MAVQALEGLEVVEKQPTPEAAVLRQPDLRMNLAFPYPITDPVVASWLFPLQL